MSSDAIWHDGAASTLIQIMACYLLGTQPQPEPALMTIRPSGTKFNQRWVKIQHSSLTKFHLKMSSAKCHPFCSPPHTPPSPVDMLPVTCSFTLAFSFLLKNLPSELSLPFFFGCLCRESWEEFWELSGLGVLWQLSRVLMEGGGNSWCSIVGRWRSKNYNISVSL